MTPGLTMEDILNFLLDAPMFGDLDSEELCEIVHIMQVQVLRDGQLVFREGELGDAWYVLFAGEVEVVKGMSGGGTYSVGTLGVGSCFGEMAILDGSPRSATVRARSEVVAFRFPRDAFDGLLKNDILAAYKLVHEMAKVLATRQRQTTRRLVELFPHPRPRRVRPSLDPIIMRSSVAE